MVFNTFTFLVFFAIFFPLYFAAKGTSRHVVLFVGSCIFYMWFIPKYILILFLAIGIDFYAALRIERSSDERNRKYWMLVGVVNTCALLFIFKYYNFFIGNLDALGLHIPFWNIILPLGLSFHTFQSLSYVIDVYRKKVPAEHNLLVYANYVMMFPQIVAGPIERAGEVMPQLHARMADPANASDFTVGMTRFFWGLVKKMVVADNIGPYVTAVYNNYRYHTGTTLLVASMFFSVQIYADFSGYSDMAIGLARALGFRFSENFDLPYFSRSIAELWRRWHISLSSWLRDYLYTPLAFAWRKAGTWGI
ncbi:MBOAT family protein, partial [Patescibacteria group bacterium]|nr:MBOAT family protein [Patescibacteria group bacterium]